MTSEKDYSTVQMSNMGYCFSPFVIDIKANSSLLQDITIIISCSHISNDYKERWSVDYKTNFKKDIRGILQSLFEYEGLNPHMYAGMVENTSKQFRIIVDVQTSDSLESHDMGTINFIYGAVEPYKRYNSSNIPIHVKQFVEFPFSVNFLLKEGALVQTNSLELVEYKGVNDNLVCIFLDKPKIPIGKSYLVYVENDKEIVVDTDSLYPIIDTWGGGGTVYYVTTYGCTDGVYLMWLNRLGGRNYFLFKKKGETLKVDGEEYNKTLSYKDRLVDNSVQQNKTATRVVTLSVPMADKNEYSYIEDVLYSPEVYVYDIDKYAFIKVNVQTGDFERTSAELQDFVFKIELPEELTIKI